jgi:hypothetical protein
MKRPPSSFSLLRGERRHTIARDCTSIPIAVDTRPTAAVEKVSSPRETLNPAVQSGGRLTEEKLPPFNQLSLPPSRRIGQGELRGAGRVEITDGTITGDDSGQVRLRRRNGVSLGVCACGGCQALARAAFAATWRKPLARASVSRVASALRASEDSPERRSFSARARRASKMAP